MKGNDLMSDTPQLSEAKRALLEKYLHGDLPQKAAAAHVITHHVEKEVADQRERVVPIQTGGSRRPFFFLHGQWKDGGFFCFPLARDLGPDQPFYALTPYKFDGLAVPPTFEDIAAAHIKSMRAVQPEGPYLLSGWCNGGLLAYEMARQLHAEKQEVDLLLLMDPVELVYPTHLRLLYAVISGIGNLLRIGQDKQLDWFLRLRHVYKFPHQLKRCVRNPQYWRSKDFWRWGRYDYPGVYDWIALGYTPTSLYPGKITFFWSITEPFRKGWRKVEEANVVEVYILPAGHMACLSEHLHDLAERLHPCLDQATLSR
jgi:Thioesterase domain